MNKLHFQIRKYGDLKIIKEKLFIYPVFDKLFSYQIFLYTQFKHNIITYNNNFNFFTNLTL